MVVKTLKALAVIALRCLGSFLWCNVEITGNESDDDEEGNGTFWLWAINCANIIHTVHSLRLYLGHIQNSNEKEEEEK